jgi:hypothetical protein
MSYRIQLSQMTRGVDKVYWPGLLGGYRYGKRRLTPWRSATTVEMVMPVPKIQIGQLWKNEKSGEVFLVTRVYSEALATMAVLRKSGSESEALIRVRVDRVPGGQNLPGYVPAQDD